MICMSDNKKEVIILSEKIQKNMLEFFMRTSMIRKKKQTYDLLKKKGIGEKNE